MNLQAGLSQGHIRLFRYFVLWSIAATLLILFLVGFGLRSILHDFVIAEAEEDAIRITAALRDFEVENLVRWNTTDKEFLSISPEQFKNLDYGMRNFLVSFDVVKIKIFDHQCRIIYSTDPSIIGQIDSRNPNLLSALGGTTVSKFETKDPVWDLENESRFDVGLVETYVPVAGRKGRIIGSFEIYKDVTHNFKVARATLLRSVGLVTLVLLVVFGGLCSLMYRASRIIESHKRALEANEARTLAIIEKAADGIVTVNEDWVVLSFNQAAERIMGYTAVEAIGRPFIGFLANPEGEEGVGISWWLRGDIQAKAYAGHEFQGRRKSGSVFPMWIAVSEVNFADGKMCTAIMRDITEQKRNEMIKREEDIKRAEEMRMVAQLATGVAHEIRNPLTSIKLFFQNNKEEALSLGMNADDLEVVEGEIARMERSLETFLDFARPSKPYMVRFNLLEAVQRVLILVEGRAALQKVVCMKFAPPGEVLAINGDFDQVQQLLLNLALNALDMMPAGGSLEVRVKATNDNYVEVCVIDSGPGINKAVLSRLFEPFVTTKEKGVGLGLVISRRIAEEHGGTLSAYNQSEGGACFVFRLPLAA